MHFTLTQGKNIRRNPPLGGRLHFATLSDFMSEYMADLHRNPHLRSIALAKTIADDKDNTAQNPPVINTRNAMRKRKIRLNSLHLCIRKPNQITRAKKPPGTSESDPKQPYK